MNWSLLTFTALIWTAVVIMIPNRTTPPSEGWDSYSMTHARVPTANPRMLIKIPALNEKPVWLKRR